jgi:octaprenyl-diphosphate synthase
MTLPLIHALKHCAPAEKVRIRNIIESKGADSNAVREIVMIIDRYDGIGAALNKAGTYIDEGKAALGIFSDSEAKTALFTVADFITERRL